MYTLEFRQLFGDLTFRNAGATRLEVGVQQQRLDGCRQFAVAAEKPVEEMHLLALAGEQLRRRRQPVALLNLVQIAHMAFDGEIAEATGANIFFKMPDGKLHTPIADCFLDGITRRTVMKLAEEIGIQIVERKIMPEEMAVAQECFLTGTAAEVTPVQSIGDFIFKPGEYCLKLTKAYSNLVNGI